MAQALERYIRPAPRGSLARHQRSAVRYPSESVSWCSSRACSSPPADDRGALMAARAKASSRSTDSRSAVRPRLQMREPRGRSRSTTTFSRPGVGDQSPSVSSASTARSPGRRGEDYEKRLRARIDDRWSRTAGSEVEPADLIREIAVYAEKTDIAEEISRLTASTWSSSGELLSHDNGRSRSDARWTSSRRRCFARRTPSRASRPTPRSSANDRRGQGRDRPDQRAGPKRRVTATTPRRGGA